MSKLGSSSSIPIIKVCGYHEWSGSDEGVSEGFPEGIMGFCPALSCAYLNTYRVPQVERLKMLCDYRVLVCQSALLVEPCVRRKRIFRVSSYSLEEPG